jgi:hypothetical protein
MSQRNEVLKIVLGCLATLGINILLCIILVLIWFLFGGAKTTTSIFGFLPLLLLIANLYLLQLVHVIPWVIYLILKKRWFFMLGVVIGALITYFLNVVLAALVLAKFMGL